MEVERLAEGLWRWSVGRPRHGAHPDHSCPGPALESSVYYEPAPEAADALVLIEPLVPESDTADAERFWSALDADVTRTGLPIAVLLGCARHTRNAHDVYRRYGTTVGVSIHVPAGIELPHGFGPTACVSPTDRLPGAVEAHPLATGSEPEVAFFLPRHRALVFADAVVGVDASRVRIAVHDQQATSRDLRVSLRKLLALDPLLLLPAHGAVVRSDGAAALAEALALPS